VERTSADEISRRRWEAAAVAAAVLLYLPTLGFGWVYDDQTEVVRNAFIRSLAHLPDIFTHTVWAGAGMETFLYRPLALVTYALNHQISGLDPWSYHLVNVVLHAACTLLVIRVGRLWALGPTAAGVAGLVFAVHPIHVEAVAAVFGRKDLLATLFVLALALTHRGALDRGGWRGVAAPLLLLAAMLSKEVGVVGVALVAAQDLWLERDRRAFLRRRDVPLLYASYLAAVAVFLLARTAVTGGLGIPDTAFWDNPLVTAPLFPRLATALVVVGKGVGLLFAPVGQSPDYSFDAIPLVTSPRDPRLAVTLLGAAALAAAASHPRLRRTALPLGVAWYLLALLPTANLLVVTGTIFAERLLYLPSVAFSLLTGAGAVGAAAMAERLSRPHPAPRPAPSRRSRSPRAAPAVAVGLALPLALATLVYARHWTDDVTLFRRAVAAVPNSTKAHHKLGEELLRAGYAEEALPYLERALEIAPDNVFAAVTLDQARAAAGRPPEGGGAASVAEILLAEGIAEAQGGAYAEAEALLAAAVAAEPTLVPAWFNLGSVRHRLGDGEGARRALTRFLELSAGRNPREEAWVRSVLGGPSGG
jgi:tetratricopeptide (TPR) repeat protein